MGTSSIYAKWNNEDIVVQPFKEVSGVVAPLNRANIDTDAIIPKQFLKAVTREGLGPFLFDNWRYLDEGNLEQDCSTRTLNQDFVLNQEQYKNAEILLTGENFGCGSSREHAVWALLDAGFRVVIAPSFADIFFSNSIKNGLLPVSLESKRVNELLEAVMATPGYTLQVDLVNQTLRTPEGEVITFDFDVALRERLIQGVDDIALTLRYGNVIRAYEERRAREEPWLFPDLCGEQSGEGCSND